MSIPAEPPLMTVLSADSWHRTLSQTDGRDKLFRLFQYVCKLIRGIEAGRSEPESSSAIAKVATLESALATSRQIWRLFKWASVYARAKPRIVGVSSAPVLPDLAAIASDAALFVYLLLDNLAFIHKTRIVPGDAPRASRRAARFWLAAVLASLAGSVYNLVKLHKRYVALAKALTAARDAEKDENNTNEERTEGVGDTQPMQEARREIVTLARKYNAASAVCAKHVGDAFVAFSLSTSKGLHPALVGFCGAISSAVGLWQVWPRYVPTG